MFAKKDFKTERLSPRLDNSDNINEVSGISEEEMKKIEPVTSPSNDESKDMTLPIAIGIAATGIVGSVSAIIIDNNKRERKNKELDFEDYTSFDDMEIEEVKTPPRKEDRFMRQFNNDIPTESSYKAVRTKRSADENYFENISLDLDSVKIDDDNLNN